MADEFVEKLLSALNVTVGNFAICEIAAGSRLKLPPSQLITLHYVLRGSGSFRSGDGNELPFAEHSLIVVPSGHSQNLGSRPSKRTETFNPQRCSTLSNGFHRYKVGSGSGLVFVCGSVTASCAGGVGLFDTLARPLVVHTAAADPLRRLYDMFLAELASPHFGMRAATEALMKLCIVALVRHEWQLMPETSSFFLGLQDRRLAKAVAEMIEEPQEQHSVDTLADIAGMSRSSFAEQFRTVFASSPMEFLQKVRLKRAEMLLTTTDMTIKQITNVVGLRSRSHFSKAFRAQYRLDPSSFRAAQVR